MAKISLVPGPLEEHEPSDLPACVPACAPAQGERGSVGANAAACHICGFPSESVACSDRVFGSDVLLDPSRNALGGPTMSTTAPLLEQSFRILYQIKKRGLCLLTVELQRDCTTGGDLHVSH